VVRMNRHLIETMLAVADDVERQGEEGRAYMLRQAVRRIRELTQAVYELAQTKQPPTATRCQGLAGETGRPG
jgi:hypothetical protein